MQGRYDGDTYFHQHIGFGPGIFCSHVGDAARISRLKVRTSCLKLLHLDLDPRLNGDYPSRHTSTYLRVAAMATGLEYIVEQIAESN